MSILIPDVIDILKDIPEGYGVIAIMDVTGDSRHMWDPTSVKDINGAEKVFNDKKTEGYTAYRVNPETGNRGEIMHKFDPQAAAIIFVPPLVGG